MEHLPVPALMADYPEAIRHLAEVMRRVVASAVPDAIEGVRSGWRLIGYDLPLGPRKRYFAYVAPEPEHVHLGFEYGAWMADPDGLLEGAHLGLRKVRYLTFRPDDDVPTARLIALTQEAARVAALPAAARETLG